MANSETVAADDGPLPAHLLGGYESFLSGRFHSEHARLRRLAHDGQKPATLLISCSDSRVSPEIIFDAHPGEIFVVRNVANLVPPYDAHKDSHGALAALEFAVIHLEVRHIVVMGHALCGGVRAFAEHHRDPSKAPVSAGDYIGRWMELIAPAAERVDSANDPIEVYADKLGKAAVMETLDALRSYAFVAEREGSGALALHGAYYDMADGGLLALDEATGEFTPVSRAVHDKAMADGDALPAGACPHCGAMARGDET
jgi:carbonic anhydrase